MSEKDLQLQAFASVQSFSQQDSLPSNSLRDTVLMTGQGVIEQDTSSAYLWTEESKQDTVAVEPEIDIQNLQKTSLISIPGKEGVKMHQMLRDSDVLFASFFISFLILAFSFREIVAFMKENAGLVFSFSKGEKLHERTVTSRDRLNLYLLGFLSVLLISVSTFIGLDEYTSIERSQNAPIVTVGLFMCAILTFAGLKYLLLKIIGFTFDLQKRIDVYNFSNLILFALVGILCFIPVLLLLYSDIEFSIVIIIMLIFFLIVLVSLFLRIILYFVSQRFSILFLIAYLCTVEIIPYLFLGVVMVKLYKVDIFNSIL